MKKTFGFLLICATLALLSLPAFANKVFSSEEGTAQDGCTGDAKAAIYAEFYKEIRGDQAKAYESAKKYLACPAETGEQTPEAKDAEAKRVAYLKDFVAKFEKARRKDQLNEKINKKDYPGAFEIGKLVFADDPDYLKGYMRLGLEGAISQNAALTSDTITYAQKAIDLIESGKAPDSWAPFENKDDASAKLNYAIGSLKLKDSPDQAIPYLLKAASYNVKFKQTPDIYAYLAEAYDRGPYAKQLAEYEAKYKGKDETPESKLALANINQIIDREVDAYARAVALGGTDARKAAWMTALTELYKFRNKSEAGLSEMITGILSKPLPAIPTPITSLPPETTPAAGSTTTVSTPPATNAVAPSTSQPATGAQPKPTSTPVKPPTATTTTKATPTKPAKPKTRKAHARH